MINVCVVWLDCDIVLLFDWLCLLVWYGDDWLFSIDVECENEGEGVFLLGIGFVFRLV